MDTNRSETILSHSLTFPYLVVLIVLQLTMKHFTDVSLLDIPSEDHVTCQEHMWKNILYIDTFFPVTERVRVQYLYAHNSPDSHTALSAHKPPGHTSVHGLVVVHFAGGANVSGRQHYSATGSNASALCEHHQCVVFH